MAFTRLRGILVPAVLLSACLLSPLAAAEPTVAQLEKQINARNAALLEMQNRVQQQDATIRKLEGQIQDLSERLSAFLPEITVRSRSRMLLRLPMPKSPPGIPKSFMMIPLPLSGTIISGRPRPASASLFRIIRIPIWFPTLITGWDRFTTRKSSIRRPGRIF